MEVWVMTRGETLKPDQIKNFLSAAVQENAEVVLSFTRLGKWYLHKNRITYFDEESILLQENKDAEDIIENQPVGICISLGHNTYLFETTIRCVEKKPKCVQIFLDFPDKVEQMHRRAYDRQSVPSRLKVKCLFWHRGHLEDLGHTPAEQYWQGRLLNLSAGGAQISVELDLKSYFSQGQLVGVQFTPMSYQRPLLLEAHVKYLIDQSEHNQFLVGVEFLGLEAGQEGREILHRLIKVITEYEKMNQQSSSGSLST